MVSIPYYMGDGGRDRCQPKNPRASQNGSCSPRGGRRRPTDRPAGLRLVATARERSSPDARRVVYGNVRKSFARTADDRTTSCRTKGGTDGRRPVRLARKVVVSYTETFGNAWRVRQSTGRPRVRRPTTAVLAGTSVVSFQHIELWKDHRGRAGYARMCSEQLGDGGSRPEDLVSDGRPPLSSYTLGDVGRSFGERTTVHAGLGRRMTAPVVCLGRPW
jgi:hypothetical protein